MKILIAYIGLSLISLASDVEIVEWKDERKLNRDDFTLVQALPNNALAIVSTGIHMSSVNKSYRAVALQNKNKSYMVAKVARGYKLREVLNHEQGHFDITEYITRRLNKALVGVSDEREANILFNRYFDSLDLIQTVYDAQTEGSIDSLWQCRWDDKLNHLLRKDLSSTWKMYPN